MSGRRRSFPKISNPNQFGEEAEQPIPLTPSQQKHMASSSRAWEGFLGAKRMTQPATVTDALLNEFVFYSLVDRDGYPRYGVDSFRYTYIPALFRFFDHQGITYGQEARAVCTNKIKSMVAGGQVSQAQLPKDLGSAPLCTWGTSTTSPPTTLTG